jgi:hypothetical protein
MSLQLRDLAALNDPSPGSSGQPMTVALDLIDEDPAQPRTEFDPVSLQELASTIADRGVCQPVSVRAHPVPTALQPLHSGPTLARARLGAARSRRSLRRPATATTR